MSSVLPAFDHRFCVDLAGGQVYRQAEKLFIGDAVKSVDCKHPYLEGRVRGAAGVYEPSLNLRSSVFVENTCTCPVGKKGRICAHAVALCLYFEANRSDLEKADSEKNIKDERPLREPSKPNRRREAEAQGQSLWKHKASDYSAATPRKDPMSEMSENRVIVDGSTNYVAIRLPLGADDSIRPLREIIKSEGFQLEPKNRRWWLRDRHKALNFLASHWSSLRDQWRAEFTENFLTKLKDVEFGGLEIDTQVADEGFHLEIRLAGIVGNDAMRRALSGGKNYFETDNGSIKLVDQGAVDKLHQIEKAVSGQADRPFTPVFNKKLQSSELVVVEDLLSEESMSLNWEPPQDWQARSKALKEISALKTPPIEGKLDHQLRLYQRIGTAWLWHLYCNQLGGILADEMGLGKTLQALALITCIQTKKLEGEPALVVCPASLVENWVREAHRFTPQLKVLKHHGPKRAREAVLLEDFDLVVTSYGTLRQDNELMCAMDWCVVIGDEAQHIKNRRSQNARTLMRLHAKGRFLLTGTPVENSLDDLLSLFEFLMPGYLTAATGKLSADDRAWHNDHQARRAAAYILRRTKKEVAPELPDKIEKTFFCDLGAQQRKFYQETLEKTRRELFEMEMAGTDSNRVRFAAFTELLRLRQVCVDPRILDSEYAADESAKLAAFDELLNECLDNGSRILVFSSFVSALKLLAAHLKAQGHRFAYLDGQTKNRLAVCDSFNADAGIPVFLISLKAGGTGLNLTGADTVVHYDPWWNPAAEAQATDRTHRIGQKRVVTSIKLIAADTVEEKVVELQAKKRELLNDLFDASNAVNAKVSLDDIKGLLS